MSEYEMKICSKQNKIQDNGFSNGIISIKLQEIIEKNNDDSEIFARIVNIILKNILICISSGMKINHVIFIHKKKKEEKFRTAPPLYMWDM